MSVSFAARQPASDLKSPRPLPADANPKIIE